MQRIGRALHISSNKNLILKGKNLPKLGDKVVDENLMSVGNVFDIFGPVSSPYVSIKLTVEEPHSFVGHILYTASLNHPKEKRRKRK